MHPEMMNDATENFFGLDPANDTTARDDIVVGSLVIPANQPVELRMHAKDVNHSFYVPELRIQQDFVPGMVIPLHFTATKPGKYELVCTQLCGLGHYNMRAYVRSEERRVGKSVSLGGGRKIEKKMTIAQMLSDVA